MVIFLLVVEVVLTKDTVPEQLRGVKHWIVTRLLPEGRGAGADADDPVGIITSSLLQHLPHATRTWFLLFMILEFIPKDACFMMIFNTK